jgi:hypothetical protein
VTLGSSLVDPVSKFLLAHQGTMKYEAAFEATTVAAPFIVDAARPVLLLTSLYGQAFVDRTQLVRDHAEGRVRYVVTQALCTNYVATHAACSKAMQWVVKHARNITTETGLPRGAGIFLYDLGPTR